MAETTDSGFIPGRGLTQDEYLFGRPDFYKDYLALSGVNVKTPKDDDDDEKDKDQYVAPSIVPTSDDGGDDNINLLSTQLTTGLDGKVTGHSNYYDAKVRSADLQSMDLTSKSWQDYKKASGMADKSSLSRDTAITGVGLGLAGVPGAMISGAVLGKPVNAPWGKENPGAGMFSAIGNYAISEKYDATKEVIAAQAAFADPDGSLGVTGEVYAGQDGGYAIYVDDTYLVRRPNDFRYIGTLPVGMTNQQVLNLEAIQKGFLPSSSGISTEQGFGVGGLGGYRADGSFVDANGNTSYYGSMKGLQQLANKEFGGDRNKAQEWVDRVRAGRTIFGSKMTLEEATRIKNEIQKTIKTQISGDATTTTKTFTPTPTDLFDPKTGLYESEVDQSEPTRTLPPSPTDLFDPRTRLYESEIDQGEPTVTLPPSPVDVYDPSRGLYESEIDQGEPTPATDNKAARDQALQRGADYANRDTQDRITANTYSFNEDDLERRDTSIDDVGTEEDPDSGGKIVCTMMNQSYGFGSFRNAIWLKYSKDNLSEEYQKGYHRIFLPLVAYAKGNGMSNKIVRNTLEHIAKHRTLDLRQEMRGAKRHTLGRLYRSMLEPLCYIVGKL
tara:strand:- start:191 stop:2023 length:1833 start_codon:yes stop_codon:yes gene_type:complete